LWVRKVENAFRQVKLLRTQRDPWFLGGLVRLMFRRL